MHRSRITCNITPQSQTSSLVFLIFWLYVQVSAESAHQFGELVADPITKELLHYTEKPETFVCAMCSFFFLSAVNLIVA